MPFVTIRFYEELNDFLPRHLPRKTTLQYEFSVKTTAKNAVEAFNIPHTEVDLLLVNGESTHFDHILEHGDHVTVYPQFETLDITRVSHIRQAPLRNPRFIVDVNLGKLANYLRMMGFDTLYQNNFSDAYIVDTAKNQKRIILTRDRGVLKYRSVTHGYFVRTQKPSAQIREVINHLDLKPLIKPFRRCMRCNGYLQQVDKTAIRHRIHEQTYLCYDEFLQCQNCGRVFWKGSHYYHMIQFIERLRN